MHNTFLSVDPYMRGRMNDTKSYVPPFQLDRPMDGEAVGEVTAVGDGAVDATGRPVVVGDTVIHGLGWRTDALVAADRTRVLDTALAPAQAYLGVLGMPGRTAYAGLLRVGEFKEGDRVFVSGRRGCRRLAGRPDRPAQGRGPGRRQRRRAGEDPLAARRRRLRRGGRLQGAARSPRA